MSQNCGNPPENRWEGLEDAPNRPGISYEGKLWIESASLFYLSASGNEKLRRLWIGWQKIRGMEGEEKVESAGSFSGHDLSKSVILM